MPRLTARGERDHCNENSPVTFASDMSRVPEASMLTVGIHSLSRQGEHDGQYGENRGGNGYAATSSFAFATSGDDTCNRKRQSDGT